jgi:hypothetical protein
MIDIDALETLAKSSGGEAWSTETGQGTFDGMHVWHEDGDAVCRVFTNLGHMPEPIMEEDLAEYIAAANPAAILALIAEVRALREMIVRIPRTPEAVIDFIGSHYNSMSPFDDKGQIAGPKDRVSYSLSVHDILSAFDWSDLGPASIDAAIGKEQA